MNEPVTIIDVRDLTKRFPAKEGGTFLVLEGVDLALAEGEIVALLGKSGSGKSTLLRTMAGLIAPTQGQVLYRGRVVDGANPGVGMVFQSFGLMPWLTVQENVELGLRARGVDPARRTARALEAIDMIGLDGFETAYPRELSGGMKQRVGFARAFVLRPDALLMDEPFSALDVLTAENLRSELLSLWSRPDFPTKTVCIVTHNIEEAVLLADRVLVLASNPGRISFEVHVDLPRPRDRSSTTFESYVDELYDALMGRDLDTGVAQRTPSNTPLPHASVGGMAGLVELVHAHAGDRELADLAADLAFEVDDLLPLVDGASLLGFLEVSRGHASLTASGRAWFAGDIDASKHLFGSVAKDRAPLVRTICLALDSSDDGTLRVDFFRDLLQRTYTEVELERQLGTAIAWVRYGELFDKTPDDSLTRVRDGDAVA